MTEQRDYLLDSTMLAHIAVAKCGSTYFDKEENEKVNNRIDAIRANGDRKIFISTVTLGESEYGLRAASNPEVTRQAEARQVVDAFLPGLILDVTPNVAREYYAELRARMFRLYAPKTRRGLAKTSFIGEWVDPATQKMLGVQENDVWIAAIAMAHNLTLVSSDRMYNIRRAAGSDLSFEDWGAT